LIPRPAAIHLLALLAYPTLSGCAPGQGAIDVTVDAMGTIHAVDHLQVVVTNSGEPSLPVVVPLAGAPVDIPPAVQFQLRFDKSRRGGALIAIDALGGSGDVLAHGEAGGDIDPSLAGTATVRLVPSTPVDAGSTNPDASAPDLAPAPLTWTLQTIAGDTSQLFFAGVQVSQLGTPTDYQDGLCVVGDNSGKGIVFAGGGLTLAVQPNPTTAGLNGIFGLSALDDLIVGESGTILYPTAIGDGVICDRLAQVDAGISSSLYAAWASGLDDLYVVGYNGVFHAIDKRGPWVQQSIIGASDSLNAIWGSDRNDVYAVGDSGTILHSDGSSAPFMPQNSGVLGSLNGIWGSGPNDVYVVGAQGTILHSSDRGGSWIAQSSGTTVALGGIWGSGANDVFAVGNQGTILHTGDGGRSWTAQRSTTATGLRAVSGLGPHDVWVVGQSAILHGQ
jgi:photosystem II stability/assembly factor-like uncharacterized protein